MRRALRGASLVLLLAIVGYVASVLASAALMRAILALRGPVAAFALLSLARASGAALALALAARLTSLGPRTVAAVPAAVILLDASVGVALGIPLAFGDALTRATVGALLAACAPALVRRARGHAG